MSHAELVADFLNSRDVRSFGEHAGHPVVDEFDTRDSLERWLVERGRLKRGDSVSGEDHRAAVRLRDRLRELLQTGGSGESAKAVNAVARRVPLAVTLSGARWQLGRRDSSGVRAYLGEVLAACALAQAEGSWPLLKMCGADDCRWVFVDRSRNRMGRWCATRVCGNRVKTRRYRERRRISASAQL